MANKKIALRLRQILSWLILKTAKVVFIVIAATVLAPISTVFIIAVAAGFLIGISLFLLPHLILYSSGRLGFLQWPNEEKFIFTEFRQALQRRKPRPEPA